MPEAGHGALVFDHGARRIGVAYANPLTGMVSPVTVLPARAGVPEWQALLRLVQEWRPDCLVVGVPYQDSNAGGSSNSESAAQRFAGEMETRCSLAVHRVDERLSSVEATARLREQRRGGVRTRRVKASDIDAEAARIIGESWLALQRSGSPPPVPGNPPS
jgi:putative holliday junction resolvase